MEPDRLGKLAGRSHPHTLTVRAGATWGRVSFAPYGWFALLLGLLALAMLGCTLPGRSEPEPTPTWTPSATPADLPTATPSPGPTQAPTPTIAS